MNDHLTHTITFRVTEEEIGQLNKVATEYRQTRTAIVREAIRSYLADVGECPAMPVDRRSNWRHATS